MASPRNIITPVTPLVQDDGAVSHPILLSPRIPFLPAMLLSVGAAHCSRLVSTQMTTQQPTPVQNELEWRRRMTASRQAHHRLLLLPKLWGKRRGKRQQNLTYTGIPGATGSHLQLQSVPENPFSKDNFKKQ